MASTVGSGSVWARRGRREERPPGRVTTALRHRDRLRTVVVGLTALAVAVVVVGCGGQSTAVDMASPVGGTVRVVGAWDGPELDAFLAVLRPFEERTGIRVLYQSTRDLTRAATDGLASGDPPEIVGLAGPRAMAELSRRGSLVDLGPVIDEATYKRDTAPSFVELGTVDGRLAGVFTRATVKGLIWYDPQVHRMAIPDSWDELVGEDHGQDARTKLWCVGLESGATSGWPGTDWIEDLVLRQSGPDVYDAWVAGAKRWTSPEMRRAFKAFGRIVAPDAVLGGPAAAAATSFSDAVVPLVSASPGCIFEHQASFLPSFLPTSARPGRDIDFFPFPSVDRRFAGSLVVGGDLFGMLRQTPESTALIRYLVSDEAQSIRVSLGGAVSANARVVDYPDGMTRRIADLLLAASRCRFDASDLMPDAMSAAFDRAVIAFTLDQSRLDAILAGLDKIQTASYGG